MTRPRRRRPKIEGELRALAAELGGAAGWGRSCARQGHAGVGGQVAGGGAAAQVQHLHGASRQRRLPVWPLLALSGRLRLGGERLVPCLPLRYSGYKTATRDRRGVSASLRNRGAICMRCGTSASGMAGGGEGGRCNYYLDCWTGLCSLLARTPPLRTHCRKNCVTLQTLPFPHFHPSFVLLLLLPFPHRPLSN